MNYNLFKTLLNDYYEKMGSLMAQLSQKRLELDKSTDKYTKYATKIEETTEEVKILENNLSELQQELIDKVRAIIENGKDK